MNRKLMSTAVISLITASSISIGVNLSNNKLDGTDNNKFITEKKVSSKEDTNHEVINLNSDEISDNGDSKKIGSGNSTIKATNLSRPDSEIKTIGNIVKGEEIVKSEKVNNTDKIPNQIVNQEKVNDIGKVDKQIIDNEKENNMDKLVNKITKIDKVNEKGEIVEKIIAPKNVNNTNKVTEKIIKQENVNNIVVNKGESGKNSNTIQTKINNKARNNIKSSDISISGLKQFEESELKSGTIKNDLKVTISNDTKATFANNIDGNVDAITSASVMGLNKGHSLYIKRQDDKNIILSIKGKSLDHDASINTNKRNNDFNNNKIYGDIKLLMLPEFFVNISGKDSVENGGIYAITDIVYKDNKNDVNSDSIINSDKTKIIKVEGSAYAVVTLSKGDINNTTFKFNKVSINPTPVNTEGTIVKFEVNPNEIAEISVTQNSGGTENITLNQGGKSFTKIIKNEVPNKILASGPISKFDYHQANYDKNGERILTPSKTTFSTKHDTNEGIDPTLPKLSINKTKLGKDVVMTFDNSSQQAKDWQKNIYKIERVHKDSSSKESLHYSIQDGKIVIDKDSVAIKDRNGVHNIRIKSKGYNDLDITIEIVKPARKVELSGDFNFWANNELVFRLKDFTYAIQNPVYEILLDGKVIEGNCIDYHVISDLIRLENDALGKLTPGKHSITIKAYGYEDSTKEFYLEEAPEGSSNPSMNHEKGNSKLSINNASISSIDTISSASGGGGSTGGSLMMRANIIYDFDLISNAMILRNLRMGTDYSNEVLSWWAAMTKDAVLTNESEKVISYQSYKNAVNEAAMKGKYLTFKSYYDSVKESNYLNGPYQIKYMLENGLFGDVQLYSQENLKIAPKLSIEGNIEDGLKINIDNDNQYTENIERVLVGMNELSKDSYKIENSKITITDTSKFSRDENIIKLVAKGYKDNIISVNLRNKEVDLKASKDNNGNILIKFDKDFKSNVVGLSLNGKSLLSDSQVGGNGDYYYIGETLVLRNKLFENKEDQQQTMIVKANKYDDSSLSFIPKKLEIKSVEKLDIPNFVKLNESNKFNKNESVLIDVEDVTDGKYRKDITNILVNGKNVEYTASKDNFYSIEIAGTVFNEENNYEITIKTNNYKDFVINKRIGKQEESKPEITVDTKKIPAPEIIFEKDMFRKNIIKSNDKDYLNSIDSIKINGKSLTKASNSYSSDGWILDKDKIIIFNELIGGSEITLESSLYADNSYKVPKKSVENIKLSKKNNGNSVFSHSDYNWTENVEVSINGKILKNNEEVRADYGQVTVLVPLSINDNILIKSEGYNDYIYNVQLVDNKVKSNKNTFTGSYTFTSSNNGWSESITSVQINGEEIEKTSEINPTKGYKFNYSGGIDLYNQLNSGDIVTIKSDGYTDYTYTF
ncbi:hemoblobin-interacting domain-containing protein [Faecalimicrobium sp. JNUCC 81]